jgi:ABC-2 type transport system permease protein
MAANPTMAIFKREWNAFVHSAVAYVFLCVFLGALGFFTFALSGFFERNNAELAGSFFRWHPWLMMVFVSAVSMRAWADERRQHTVELLFTLPCTLSQAVVGKFLAGWAFMGLCLILTFPTVITVSWLGDPDLKAIFAGYIGSFLVAGAFLAVGNFCSSLTKSQVISLIVSIIICFTLILVGFPPVTQFLAGAMPQTAVDFIASFGVIPHFESMQRGVIDLRDLIYFASVIGLMLLATQITLTNKAAR